MYTVSKIDEINTTTFDEIYNSNKTQLVSNIGYDNLEQVKSTFVKLEELDLLFQAVNDSGQVMAYFAGNDEGSTAFMYNMITRNTDTLPLTIESSASMLKSLNYTHVDFCVKDGSATQSYCKNSMNRTDLYEYLSETNIGDYMRVSLRLV